MTPRCAGSPQELRASLSRWSALWLGVRLGLALLFGLLGGRLFLLRGRLRGTERTLGSLTPGLPAQHGAAATLPLGRPVCGLFFHSGTLEALGSLGPSLFLGSLPARSFLLSRLLGGRFCSRLFGRRGLGAGLWLALGLGFRLGRTLGRWLRRVSVGGRRLLRSGPGRLLFLLPGSFLRRGRFVQRGAS